MLKDADLKRIERSALRDMVRDGLIDMFIGLILFLEGGLLQHGSIAFTLPLVFFGPHLVAALKRRLVYPRIGYVEVAWSDSKRVGRWLLGLGLAVVAVTIAVLLISGDIRDAARWYHWMPVPFGMVAMIGFAFTALKSRLVRFYFYAVLTGVGGAMFPFLPLTGKLETLSLYLISLGLPILVCGAIVFVRFLRNNPVQGTEATNGC
jgi:hypothetical protein